MEGMVDWLFNYGLASRSAHEWASLLEVNIVDPDGWRLTDGVEMDDEINLLDFIDRLAMSTIQISS